MDGLARVGRNPACRHRKLPVERNLIRNVLQTMWDGRKPLSKGEQNRFFDARSMSIAEGANPERMRVVGWVEDEKGQVRLAAQSRCSS